MAGATHLFATGWARKASAARAFGAILAIGAAVCGGSVARAADDAASSTAVATAAFDRKPGLLYATVEQQELRADAYVPRGEGPFPGVLLVHGGAWAGGNRSHMERIAARLAEHGYSALAISYRLAPKFTWPAQIDDCRCALRWLHANAEMLKVDRARVGALGYSAGGQLVALLGTTETSSEEGSPPAKGEGTSACLRLQAVVAGGAPCDFRLLPAENRSLAYWLGGTRGDKPEAYNTASPLAFVSAQSAPMLFYHGDADKLVPVLSPMAMVASLKAAGVSASLKQVKGGHIEAFFSDDGVQAAIEFLDRQLKPARPAAAAASPVIQP